MATDDVKRPELAEALDLEAHPEGGWFRETWRSAVSFQPEGYDGNAPARPRSTSCSRRVRSPVGIAVRSTELWLWHSGGPLTLDLGGTGDDPGSAEPITLGPDVHAGQHPQAVVPAGAWQAARPAGDQPVLVSCIVSPGFDFADFTLI